GMVKHALLETLLSAGGSERFFVTVLGEEPVRAYDRVRLASVLHRGEAHGLWLTHPRWYDERGVQGSLGDPVVVFDRERRVVATESGRLCRYDRVVLATGSQVRAPQIAGAGEGPVFTFRTLADAEALRRAAVSARRAVVVGGGLLGLESAKALADLRAQVTLV